LCRKANGVKRGNLHPEQHQIGKRGAQAPQIGSIELAGRWLEPAGNFRPRGMAVTVCGSLDPQIDRTRLIGRLLFSCNLHSRTTLRREAPSCTAFTRNRAAHAYMLRVSNTCGEHGMQVAQCKKI